MIFGKFGDNGEYLIVGMRVTNAAHRADQFFTEFFIK
jgi:hypothetical protein